MNEQIENNSEVYELASIKRRALGFIIDMSIWCIFNFLFSIFFGVILFLGSLLVLTCCFGGNTPGKKLLRIKIVDNKFKEPSRLRLFVRNISGKVFYLCGLMIFFIAYAITPNIGVLQSVLDFQLAPIKQLSHQLQIIYFIYGYIYLPFRDKDKRAIHDKIAGTKVIYLGNKT